jgi:hypothetical protein
MVDFFAGFGFGDEAFYALDVSGSVHASSSLHLLRHSMRYVYYVPFVDLFMPSLTYTVDFISGFFCAIMEYTPDTCLFFISFVYQYNYH